jgi:hypothetical protein
LEHEEARAWLQEKPWREVLPQIAGAELLFSILEAPLDLRQPFSVSAFLAGLTSEEESFLTGLLMERPFPQPMVVAHDSWQDLERTLRKAQITALESRMRLPDVSAEETTRVMKEILDLQLGRKDSTRL